MVSGVRGQVCHVGPSGGAGRRGRHRWDRPQDQRGFSGGTVLGMLEGPR